MLFLAVLDLMRALSLPFRDEQCCQFCYLLCYFLTYLARYVSNKLFVTSIYIPEDAEKNYHM